jgi:hypothetical protein
MNSFHSWMMVWLGMWTGMYAWALPALFLTGIVFRRYRFTCKQALAALNGATGGLLLVTTVLSFSLFLPTGAGSSGKQDLSPAYPATHSAWYLAFLLWEGTAALLLLFTRWRASWTLSLGVLLLLHQETLITWLLSLYRDYLPSSWSADSYRYPHLPFLFLSFAAWVVSYLLLRWLDRLPQRACTVPVN